MALDRQVFVYCERGTDPGFLAEPLNAVTNAAFVVAGVWALIMILRRPAAERAVTNYILAILTVLIGIGSFLFHTYATVWAAIADVAPIGLFMLIYFAIAMRRFLGLPVGGAAALTLGFALMLWAARYVRCGPDLMISIGSTGGRCLNGSVGYLPALLALVLIGIVLAVRRHPAGGSILTAGGLFAVSLTLRTVDPLICSHVVIAGYTLGSHFLWHLLNALSLFVLMRAVIVLPVNAGSITGGYSSDQEPHADLRQRNSARQPRSRSTNQDK